MWYGNTDSMNRALRFYLGMKLNSPWEFWPRKFSNIALLSISFYLGHGAYKVERDIKHKNQVYLGIQPRSIQYRVCLGVFIGATHLLIGDSSPRLAYPLPSINATGIWLPV